MLTHSMARSTRSNSSMPCLLKAGRPQLSVCSTRLTSRARCVSASSSHVSPLTPGLSGITWSGFDNVYYLFTHNETSSSFAIPHDIRILEEVFKVPIPGETREQYHARPYYNKKNAFLTSTSIEELSSELAEDDRKQAMEKAQGIRKQYAQLSEGYQKDKGNVGIPLA